MVDRLDTIECKCGEVYTARLHIWRENVGEFWGAPAIETMAEYCDDDRCPKCNAHPDEGKVLNSEEMIPDPEPDIMWGD